MEKVVTSTRPGRALARRFVAGDTLDDAVAAARELNSSGLLVSLDHLGEEVHDRASAMQATEEYLESLNRIADEDLDSNISVKPTQLGLAIDDGLAMESIDLLATRAKKVGTSVTIDMEDSRYTDSTVRLYEKAQAEHGNLGIAIQTYLHRTPQDLARLIPLGGHIRLCKGAYVESEEVALTSNPEINDAFVEQMQTIMASEETKPAIATHDMSLLDLARELTVERNHPFEFQMLYGVRRELQEQLVTEGYPVRVYLPFGSQWYPYLTRRLADRPSNAWFLVRAAFGS